MKISKKKIEIAMARNCMNTVDLQKTRTCQNRLFLCI